MMHHTLCLQWKLRFSVYYDLRVTKGIPLLYAFKVIIFADNTSYSTSWTKRVESKLKWCKNLQHFKYKYTLCVYQTLFYVKRTTDFGFIEVKELMYKQ